MQYYYYLIASLPYLYHDRPAPLSRTEFLKLCKTHMKDSDYDLLQSVHPGVTDDDACQLSAVIDWREWERGLRNELVRLRSERLGIDRHRFMKGTDRTGLQSVRILAKNAFSAATPLMADKMLNMARWKFLDGLESGNHFNLPLLVIYSIRLQLLERMALFDSAKGMKRLSALLASSDEKGSAEFEENE